MNTNETEPRFFARPQDFRRWLAIYSYEQREAAAFDAGFERRFRARKAAWTFFQAQPPGYRQLATYWVMTAKREETREKRLEKLIEVSEAGKRI